MTTEPELRKELATFGIGFELIEFGKRDRVNLYPTRSKGVHKISLDLRCHLAEIELADMLKYCLSKSDFQAWKTTKQMCLVTEQKEVKPNV